jgi:hypothetical protein
MHSGNSAHSENSAAVGLWSDFCAVAGVVVARCVEMSWARGLPVDMKVLPVGMKFALGLSVAAFFSETSGFVGQSVVRILTQDC